jgi:hypothetical protein
LAIWHFFLSPTPKGAYPILTFLKREKKECDNSHLKHILQLIGAPDDYISMMKFDDMVTGISKPNDLKALSLLLSYASSELAKLFYEFVPSDCTPKPVRNIIMHFALDVFDKNCVDRFKWHRLRFDEIYSEFGNVSTQGLFALLFNHGYDINCKSFYWVVNEREPIQQLASVNTQMFYLKYLYYGYVPDYRWEEIESCILESDCIEVRLLALELYAKFHKDEARKILEFFNACYPYIKDDNVFYFLPKDDVTAPPSFLLECLSPHGRNRDWSGIIEGLAAIAFEENLKMGKQTELYDITLKLCDRLNDLRSPALPTINELLVFTFRKVLNLEHPNKKYLEFLSQWLKSKFCLSTEQCYYVKCVGGDAVVAVSPIHSDRTATGVNGFYGKLDYSCNEFKVIGFYGSVRGRKDYVLSLKIPYNRNCLDILKIGDGIDLDDHHVLYFKLEDAIKAPFG